MKIAMFAPFFGSDRSHGFTNYYEYWLRSAAANQEIDFYVLTNLDVSRYTKYDNIYYIKMTDEEFWGKIQAILKFPISHDYYKTAEYRVFFGILFEDILRDYDYWGMTEFDMIYGNILKFVKPYLEKGSDIIGRTASLRIIKNVDKLRYMPFEKMMGISHPLVLNIAFSTDHEWYFSESGMNIIYHQKGIDMVHIDDHFGDIAKRYKYLSCNGLEGMWGFNWENGNLIGYNDLGEKREFLAIHLQKRKIGTPDEKPSDMFCIIPNSIYNNVKDLRKIKLNSMCYTVCSLWKTYSKAYVENRKLDDECKQVKKEIKDYCEKNDLFPPSQSRSFLRGSLHRIARNIIG